jgi:CobQ-like glutamine amidotransferase family enzyme
MLHTVRGSFYDAVNIAILTVCSTRQGLSVHVSNVSQANTLKNEEYKVILLVLRGGTAQGVPSTVTISYLLRVPS